MFQGFFIFYFFYFSSLVATHCHFSYCPSIFIHPTPAPFLSYVSFFGLSFSSACVTHHWWPCRSSVSIHAMAQSLFVGDANTACLRYSAFTAQDSLLPDRDHRCRVHTTPRFSASYTCWIDCNSQCRTLAVKWGEWSKMAALSLRGCVGILHCSVLSGEPRGDARAPRWALMCAGDYWG